MRKLAGIALLAACALVASCERSGDDSVSEGVSDSDTAAYDGISESEILTLVGTEPFWGAEIEGSDLRWTTPENIEGRVIEVSRFAGNNGMGFSGELEGEAMQVAVTPGVCSDGMSDRTYPFTATISLGERQLFGCGYTDLQPYSGEENP